MLFPVCKSFLFQFCVISSRSKEGRENGARVNSKTGNGEEKGKVEWKQLAEKRKRYNPRIHFTRQYKIFETTEIHFLPPNEKARKSCLDQGVLFGKTNFHPSKFRQLWFSSEHVYVWRSTEQAGLQKRGFYDCFFCWRPTCKMGQGPIWVPFRYIHKVPGEWKKPPPSTRSGFFAPWLEGGEGGNELFVDTFVGVRVHASLKVGGGSLQLLAGEQFAWSFLLLSLFLAEAQQEPDWNGKRE